MLALFGLIGCEKPKESAEKASPAPAVRFEGAMIDKIVPLPNGDAYAVAPLDGAVWLLRKNEAVRVRVREVQTFSAGNKPGLLRPFVYQEAPSQDE